MDDDVELTLTAAEALILYEFLNLREDAGWTPPVDQAEQRVLWDLESLLESHLVAPLRPDYDELLVAARRQVLAKPPSPGTENRT